MGRLEVDWQDSAPALRERYRKATDHQDRTRLHALWLLRQGRARSEVAKTVGVCYESVRRWIEWYRGGDLAEVLSRRHGGSGGPTRRLSEGQEKQLRRKAERGELATVWDGVEWARTEAGVEYSYWGMRHVFERLNLRKKVPRRQAPEADPEAQEAWKKGLERAPGGGRQPADGVFGDEMRLGLIGQVRRRWTPRGVKLRQAMEFTYEWSYLSLAVDPMKGILKWAWTPNMKAASIAPELQPVERVFEYVRSQVEAQPG